LEINLKKQLIVETAFRLFKQNGFYATGVDLIMREAGVSKRTLYKYFRTKNDLIIAVLEYYRSSYQQHLDDLLGKQSNSAEDKIRIIFEDAKSWFGDTNFHGCLAVNAMAEYAGKDGLIEDSCLEFKRWEIDVLQQLCLEMDAKDHEKLAYKLFVLLEGMSAIAQVNKGSFPVDMTEMANRLIAEHMN
jgi:AcrR family transcriptional regulator